VTEGQIGDTSLSTPPSDTDADLVNSDMFDHHPPINTMHNGQSPPATDDHLRSDHIFHVPLQKRKSQASPRESLIRGDSVWYSPSEDSPDTSPEIIETPFFDDMFSFIFDDRPLSSSPEKGTDHQPDTGQEWSSTEQRECCSSKTSSVASSSDDRCAGDVTPKVTERSEEVLQDVLEESQPKGKDSCGETRSKVKKQRPKSSNRNRVKLVLVTKMKISDKPVRSLIQTRYDYHDVVMVFMLHVL